MQLVEPVGPTGERYRLHDLLAVYASELAEQDPVEERQAAVKRALAWYLEQSEQRKSLLSMTRTELEQLFQHDPHLGERARSDRAAFQATLMQMVVGWFEAERASLVALQRQAAELREHETVWQLAASLAGFFDQRKHWSDWQATHERALLAARDFGDRAAQGLTLGNLGIVYREQGRFAEAIDSFEQALTICRELGDRYGEGQILRNLGVVYRDQGRFAEAIDSLEESLAIRLELGHGYDEGQTLASLAEVYAEQGVRDRAEQCYMQALAIFQELQASEAEQVAAAIAELRRPRGLRAILTGWRRR